MPTSTQWYYLKADLRQGPVERLELVRLLHRGVLPPDTQVWQDGMRDWVPAAEAPALAYRPLPVLPGEGGRVWLQGPLATYRHFVTDEVPRLVAETHLTSQAGGSVGLAIQRTIGLEKWRPWYVLADTATHFEASVLLDRTSTSWAIGFRRIAVRAVEHEGDTLVTLFETKRQGWIVFAVVFLTCFPILPVIMGAVIAFVNQRHTAFNKKVMAQVAKAVRARFPAP